VASSFVALLPDGAYPPLRITATNGGTWATDESASTSVRGPAFELLRALGGRRSLRQLRALDWSDDPEPYLPAFEFGPFHTPAEDIVDA
jgi:hypothetical protein